MSNMAKEALIADSDSIRRAEYDERERLSWMCEVFMPVADIGASARVATKIVLDWEFSRAPEA